MFQCQQGLILIWQIDDRRKKIYDFPSPKLRFCYLLFQGLELLFLSSFQKNPHYDQKFSQTEFYHDGRSGQSTIGQLQAYPERRRCRCVLWRGRVSFGKFW